MLTPRYPAYDSILNWVGHGIEGPLASGTDIINLTMLEIVLLGQKPSNEFCL